jgi:hemolysin activation/secretion protein
MIRFFAIIIALGVYCSAYAQQHVIVKSKDSTHHQPVFKFDVDQNTTDLEYQIKDQLYQKGYFNLQIKEKEQKNDTIIYKVIYGNDFPYLLIQTDATAGQSDKKDSLLMSTDQYQDYAHKLLEKYAKEGKVFTQVSLKNINQLNDSTMAAQLVINESKTRELSEIIIKGYKDFPRSFIKYYLGIKKFTPFNKDRIIKKSKNLNDIAFAQQIKEPQVQFTKDSTLLYMFIEKTRSNRFEGFLGFTNNDQQELQLNGDLDLRLNNNFNYGEQFKLKYKNNGQDQERFTIGIKLPYLFQSPVSLSADLAFFRQDSTFSTSEQFIGANYQINSAVELKAGGRFNKSTSLQDQPTIVSDTTVLDYEASSYRVGTEIRLPSNIKANLPLVNFIDLEVGIGNRSLINESDNDAKQQQWSVNLNNKWYIPVNKRQFIYLGNFNQWLISDEYVTNELYRFGGMKNVRGFPENSLFADFYTTLQTEYRYILSKNLFAHSVFDLAYYENQVQNINKNLYSFGFGIGLKTGGGILRLILANGNETNQSIKLNQTQFHLNFSSFF